MTTINIDPLPTLSTLTPFAESDGYQWHYCLHPGCTAIFKARTAGPERQYCDKHEEKEGYYVRKGAAIHYEKTLAWEVVRDPLPQEFGGYSVGTYFQHHEIKEALDLGLAPPGLQLRYKDTVYTVVRKTTWYTDQDGKLQPRRKCYLRANGRLFNYSDIKAGRG